MAAIHTVDMTGQRYGRLVCLHPVPHPPFNNVQSTFWLCRCDCGNEHITSRKCLIGGHTRSCGCLRKEVSRELLTSGNRQGKTGRRKNKC